MATAYGGDTIEISMEDPGESQDGIRDDPDSTTVKEVSRTGITSHQLNLTGLAGGLSLAVSLALICCLLSFVSISWSVEGDAEHGGQVKVGLWDACLTDTDERPSAGWYVAVQVMVCLALVCLIISVVFMVCYIITSPTISALCPKNTQLLLLLASLIAAGVFFMIGVIVFGAEKLPGHSFSWAFYMALGSTVLCMVAGSLAVLQLWRSRPNGQMPQ